MVFLFGVRDGPALDPRWATTQYFREQWTRREGLPQLSVLALAQDQTGFVWLGTQEGLARFDGVEFVSFALDDTPALGGNDIGALAADPFGRLWIGTESGTISRFDGREFLAATVPPRLGRVLALAADSDGGIWAAFEHSPLMRAKVGTVFVTAGDRAGLPTYADAIARSERGELLLAGRGELLTVEGEKLVHRPILGGLKRKIRALAAAPDGASAWLGLEGNELAQVRREGEGFRLTGRSVAVGAEIRALELDRDGALWIASADGLLRAGPDLERLERIAPAPRGDTRALLTDRAGGLWIGTHREGLLRLSAVEVQPVGKAEGLPDDVSWNVLTARDGTIWISTDGGLTRVEGDRLVPFTHPSLPGGDAIALHESRDGALWVGTFGRGLYRLAPDRLTVKRFSGAGVLPNEYVTAVFEDSRGELWVGTRLGLARRRGGTLVPVPLLESGVQPYVSAVTEDGRGTVWVATMAGLFAFSGESVRRFAAADGLPSEQLNSVLVTADGTVWVASNGSGMARLRNGRVSIIGTRNGLPTGLILWLVLDRGGRLWLSTNRGLFVAPLERFEAVADGSARELGLLRLDEADGMRSAECNNTGQPAGAEGPDGRLWFPTMNGVAVVDPRRLESQALTPVMITATSVDGERRPWLHLPDRLDLPAGTHELDIDFAALGFDEAKEATYRYRLLGLSAKWAEIGTRRSASFTNLSPGDYSFEVEARDADGGPWAPTTAIPVSLAPLWHQRQPVRLALALLGVALIALAWRLRSRRLAALVARRTRELDARSEEVRGALRREAAARELSERRQVELERAAAAKDEFLAMVSHELRTPLNAVLGLTSLMLDSELAEEQREQAEIVNASGHQLLRLVNQLLEYSRIERGGLELEEAPFELVPTIEQALAEVVSPAAMRELDVAFWADAASFRTVRGDAGRLRQVAVNLIGNALKFTLAGGVIVRVRSRSQERVVEVALEVADTGIGIPEQHRQRIFEPFSQVEASHSRRFGGAGLGLAISSRLCRQMGGDLELESAVGRGSIFTARLRLGTEGDLPGEAWERRQPLAGRGALLVGLPAQTAEAVGRQLAVLGAAVTARTAEGGGERPSEDLPESGFVFVAERVEEVWAQALAAVESAAVVVPVGRTVAAASATSKATLRLPIRPSAVVSCCRRLLGLESGSLRRRAAPLAATSRALRVLIVEDNEINQLVVMAMLGKLGHQGRAVDGGRQALAELATASFDVVLLDLQMPEMDGFEVAEQIHRTVQPVPHIIALTASALDSDRERGFAVGMNDYLTKPVWPEQLAAALERAGGRGRG